MQLPLLTLLPQLPLELVPPCDIDLGFADDNGAKGHLLGVLGLLVLLLLPCESHRVAIFFKIQFLFDLDLPAIFFGRPSPLHWERC